MLRLAFYVAAVALALIHVFVTFRGINSTEGMYQAQLARNLAQKGVWQTLAVQPYAWAQLERNGRTPTPLAMPETTQLPVQPLIWSLGFRAFSGQAEYAPLDGGGRIYIYDRVIAGFGVLWWLIAIYLTHGAARQLFDEKVAAIAAVALLVCQPAWDLAVSGSSRMLLIMEFALAFRLFVSIAMRHAAGRSTALYLVTLGVISALMLLTHPLALWLVLGLAIGATFFLKGNHTTTLLLVLAPVVLAAGAWGWWQARLCGEVLGGLRAVWQSQFAAMGHELVTRDFTPGFATIVVDDLLRRMGLNTEDQSGRFYSHCGHVVVALFFFIALLHQFRRAEASAARWTLAVTFGSVVIGMTLIGLSGGVKDDMALYIVIMPAMCIYGAAMLVILWSRFLGPNAGTTFWPQWGGPVIALVLCAIPMYANLPVFLKYGLAKGNSIDPHWPPYVPDRVVILNRYVRPGEYVFTDAPHFIAWYAGVPAVNLPTQREDFATMKKLTDGRNATVGGFVMTPFSARTEYFFDLFSGNYSEWRDLIYRGHMLAFDKNFDPEPSFPYRIIHPLLLMTVGSKESTSLPMVFYAEQARTPKAQPIKDTNPEGKK
ncbi:MAG: hypothetical protein IPK32_07365 [Verrucomicrobiaceae bacterium]|nr:hypothetical protein [Verrucomicrobiaceae bacterium]